MHKPCQHLIRLEKSKKNPGSKSAPRIQIYNNLLQSKIDAYLIW